MDIIYKKKTIEFVPSNNIDELKKKITINITLLQDNLGMDENIEITNYKL